jgi:putative aldouronate transport system substrate-binding protein
MRKIVPLALTLCLALASVAAQPTKLVFMLWGDKPAGMDDVLAEFRNRTAATLNLDIQIVWTPLGEYFNKVKLKMAAGEQMDVVFDAPWAGMVQASNQGLYQDIGSYFGNDRYPGLKKAFDSRYVNNNKFNDKMIGVPFTQGYKEIYGYFIRKDLREKYGLPPINSLQELENYFALVKARDPNLIPLADDGNALRWVYGLNDELETFRARKNIFQIPLVGGLFAGIELSPDHKRVVNVEFSGDRLGDEEGVPYDTIALSQRWKTKGYFEADLLTQQNAVGLFQVGKSASVAHGISMMASLENELRKSVPTASVEFFVASDSQRAMLPKAMRTDFKAFNFACIPASSKNTEAVMRFFNWIFSDKDNHDLFELGIKGKDWLPVGEDRYVYPSSGPRYIFPGYQLTWNPGMIRTLDGMPDLIYKLLAYSMDVNNYYQTPLGGFQFNSGAVRMDIARVTPVMDQIGQIYGSGIYSDTAKRVYDLNQRARRLGLDKIREEARKQIEAYLARR